MNLCIVFLRTSSWLEDGKKRQFPSFDQDLLPFFHMRFSYAFFSIPSSGFLNCPAVCSDSGYDFIQDCTGYIGFAHDLKLFAVVPGDHGNDVGVGSEAGAGYL